MNGKLDATDLVDFACEIYRALVSHCVPQELLASIWFDSGSGVFMFRVWGPGVDAIVPFAFDRLKKSERQPEEIADDIMTFATGRKHERT